MSNKKFSIQLYSIHGLIRGENIELGRDADTGGQTKYVVELANSLSKKKEIKEVELITRLIDDKTVSTDYSKSIEIVNEKFTIVRIQCGGRKYMRKELLWNYLEEFVDKTIKYIKSKGYLPDIIHSHYADAGYVCTKLSQFFGIPFVHTSHSLGRLKLNDLLNQNLDYEEINKKYNIEQRIDAEENVLFYADKIITSTKYEIAEQYSLYKNKNPEKFLVIPPGIELDRFFPYNEKREWDEDSQIIRDRIRDEMWKFFTNMYKPLILTVSRPDKRKNIDGLIKAYGEDEKLKDIANLAIFAGIRKDISEMPDVEKDVLTEMLLLMDKYNLYGKMAIPKKHDVKYGIPELYRIAAETEGVFVNPSFTENFGLTLIEAAASGVPVVSTDKGGPKEIIEKLKNGISVDVSEPQNISNGIERIIVDKELWKKYSNSGINNVNKYFSWEAHVAFYLEHISRLVEQLKTSPKMNVSTRIKFFDYNKLMIFDIDDTITGDKKGIRELKIILENLDRKIGFGVATGRTIQSAKEIINEIDMPLPDVLIASVGSEIYYRHDHDFTLSTGWKAHISPAWKRDKILELLSGLENLQFQDDANQTPFRIGMLNNGTKEDIENMKSVLVKNKIKANVIVSHNKFIDILPYRASKGRAVRYLSYRWNIPLDNILVAGDSGNDEDMLKGELLGIVVGNYEKELENLKEKRKIYFARNKFSYGIIEGINYYKFLERD